MPEFEAPERSKESTGDTVRIDQDSSEIIDAGRKIKGVTKSQYDRINLERKSKGMRTVGYEKTNIRDSRDDYNIV